MTKRKMNFPQWCYPMISFFLALLIWIGLLAGLQLAPFGNRIFFMSDVGAQYLPFLAYFKEAIMNGEGLFYSFQNGIGGNMVPLFAYYLTSPFNLITLFFDTTTLPVAIHLLIVIKMASSAAAMCWYLTKTYHHPSFMTVALSIAYAFCGFAAAYFYNLMWLDALIWLPLVVLALQRLLDEGSKLPYIIFLFLLIISNYYLGYMVCLFLVLYTLYWKREKKAFLRFVGSSLVAALMTGVLLAPTVFGMMTTGKGDFDFTIFYPQVAYGLDGLSGFGLGISDFSSRLNHLPTFFSGFIALILAGSYFQNEKIAPKEKKNRLLFLMVLLAITWFRPFVAVFQAFQPAAGFPFRNSFLVSFFVIIMAYENWLHREGIKSKHILRITGALSMLFIVAFFVNQLTYKWFEFPQMNGRITALNVGLTLVAGALLLVKKKRLAVLVILLFSMVDVSANFLLTLKGINFGDYANYQRYTTDVAQGLDERENDLSRVDNTKLEAKQWGVSTNGYNDGLHFGFPGVAAYTSTLSEEKINLYHQLGLYSRNERRISYIGSTPWTDWLFNVGYRLESTDTDLQLIQNPNPSSIGFLVPPETEQLQLNGDLPFDNQNLSFQTIHQTDESLFVPVADFAVHESDLSLTVAEDGLLYVWLPRQEGVTYQNIKVNGKDITTKLRLDEEMMLALGDFSAGEEVTVTVDFSGPGEFSPELFQTFRTAVFQNAPKLATLTSPTWQHSRLTGDVTVPEANHMLLLSIIDDPGWQITVNGEKAETVRVMDGFLGVTLPEGRHVIEATFTPPGLKVGLVLSLVGSVIFLFLLVRKISKKSHRLP